MVINGFPLFPPYLSQSGNIPRKSEGTISDDEVAEYFSQKKKTYR
jgi:hypothetical protein